MNSGWPFITDFDLCCIQRLLAYSISAFPGDAEEYNHVKH